MSHLVIYDIDGAPQYHRFVAIDEAVALVERLRNEGNGSAHLYRLEEIQFEIRAYYRVEVGTPPPAVAVLSDREFELPPATAEQPDPEPMTVEALMENIEDEAPMADFVESAAATADRAEMSGSLGGARRGLFGR